jgi:hypothetical protein
LAGVAWEAKGSQADGMETKKDGMKTKSERVSSTKDGMETKKGRHENKKPTVSKEGFKSDKSTERPFQSNSNCDDGRRGDS